MSLTLFGKATRFFGWLVICGSGSGSGYSTSLINLPSTGLITTF